MLETLKSNVMDQKLNSSYNGGDKGVQAMTKKTPFQVMPPLEEWEFAALKASIKKYGVLLPVVKDESGTVIDGHHREQVCQELGIENYPVLTIGGLTKDEKRNHALILNLVRRKLTRQQLREIIRAELRRQPDISNRWLAEILGTTDKTVDSVRQQLISTSEIPHLEKLRGKDGKARKTTRVITYRGRDAERVQLALQSLEEDAPKRNLQLHNLERIARKNKRVKSNTGKYLLPSVDASIRLYHSDFQNLTSVAKIKAGSVDLFFTDVPYDLKFTDQFAELAQFAQFALKDGGVCVIYIGVLQLASCLEAFSNLLNYQAVAFSSWSGNGSVIQKIQCVTQTTPVLVFSKGKWTRTTRWYNVYHNETPEHDLHCWQKPLCDSDHWLKSFSDPGDLVLDPCCGSGTTALACKLSNRRFVGGDLDLDAVRLAQKRLTSEEVLLVGPNISTSSKKGMTMMR